MRRLGKATVLSETQWTAWLKHVLQQGPTWLWVALTLSHCFCLRISEVLTLRKCDFSWTAKQVHIGPLKRQEAVSKAMLTAALPHLKSLRDHGKSRQRKQARGVLGTVSFKDSWSWPEEETDFLFPAGRSDCQTAHRNKDSACAAVSRLRKSFKPPKGAFVQTELIRTHTGRHSMINQMKDAGIPQATAMTFARIADTRTYLGYGCLTHEQAGLVLDSSQALQKKLDTVYRSHKNENAGVGKSVKRQARPHARTAMKIVMKASASAMKK